jgi:CRP-like cAMP-binding protein
MPVAIDVLKNIPYLKGLADEEMAAVAKKVQELSFQKGQIIFLEGDPCQGLYIVKAGRIRIFKTSSGGREHVFRLAQPGESFNDIPVYDGGPNPASASALEPSIVYLVPKDPLVGVVAKCPGASAVVSLLAGRIRHLNTMLENLAFRSVASRLAKLLSDMATSENPSAPAPRLTQDDMAAMVGSVRDVVGRALKYLEKSGAIKLEGHRIVVVSLEKLKDMA